MGMKEHDGIEITRAYGSSLVHFQDLMRHRIHDILLVSSLYDSFILGEDGRLYEMLLNEYIGLNLSHTPDLTRVSSGRQALEILRSKRRFDMVITTLHLEDMSAIEFAQELHRQDAGMPLVLLTYDSRELNHLLAGNDASYFNKIFMWQGNFRVLLAIVKCIEDMLNVEDDTKLVGVQSIILIEDNVKFYSSYLPIIYTELMGHSQRLISEGINLAHKILRMRARPKILLCNTYEEAWKWYETYHETILGVISDVRFPRGGKSDPQAGIDFVQAVKRVHPDTPVLLQSTNPQNETLARELGASFLLKNSPTLLRDLSRFMQENFSFGDFVFRLPEGTEVGRARDLRELRQELATIPDESLLYHAERNHFSNWLKARTEFFLAHRLRPRKVSDFASTADLRKALMFYLQEYHALQQRGAISDFDSVGVDPEDCFARIGSGSLGGKGRGLAFTRTFLEAYRINEQFDGIRIKVPPTVVLCTDIFEQFLEQNNLMDFAMKATDDREIVDRFVQAKIPTEVENRLRDFLRVAHYPLAVRSSSLLEDSQYHPFAGIYATHMVANNHRDLKGRLVELLSAVKRVYASTFCSRAKSYIRVTPYRLEEEKMAVIIQKLVGQSHENRFYPDFAGVARSHNFYPIHPMVSEDGIASVALGLGTMVSEGGTTVRFCPKYPRHLIQFSRVEDAVNYSQKDFYALELPDPTAKCDHQREVLPLRFGLDFAEKDGILDRLGSTYSPENDAIYDGISRYGVRLVSFAPVLKDNLFPLCDILNLILELGKRGISGPAEIEFSVNMSVPKGQPQEFNLVQLRPMVISHEREQLETDSTDEAQLLCRSTHVLGNGFVDDIRDVVIVDKEQFDRSQSIAVAKEIEHFNNELVAGARPYLLIGVGRWGSADPWLGIPVKWEQISGARVIVETGFKDMDVTPSQGTHFFQNLTAFQVGYFTIDTGSGDTIDWDWLKTQEMVTKRHYTYHMRLELPLSVKMDGYKNEGVIIKPQPA